MTAEGSAFRPIHYLGSKLRILDTIDQAVDSVAPGHGRVCDLFSGSGTVSRHLAFSRPVTAVDIQEYSRVLCSAVLMPERLPYAGAECAERITASPEYAELIHVFDPLLDYERAAMQQAADGQIKPLYDIVEHGSLLIAARSDFSGPQELSAVLEKTLKRLAERRLDDSVLTMVTRYFGGLYFSYAQAVDVDAALEFIFRSTDEGTGLRDVMLAALLSAVSEIVDTVGKQFAQPLQVRDREGRLKKGLLKKILGDRSEPFLPVFARWLDRYGTLEPTPFSGQHEALRMDYRQALGELRGRDVAVIYADPPYTRYHYSRYYHVLETICFRDQPEVSPTFSGGTQLSRGMYRKQRHQSPFCIRSQAAGAFDELFQGAADIGAPFVLSYSPYSESSLSVPRMQTISQLLDLAHMYYEKAEIISPGYFVHSKLNTVENNYAAGQEAELLILCRNAKRRG